MFLELYFRLPRFTAWFFSFQEWSSILKTVFKFLLFCITLSFVQSPKEVKLVLHFKVIFRNSDVKYANCNDNLFSVLWWRKTTFYGQYFTAFLVIWCNINISTIFMFPCKCFDIFLHKYGSVVYDAFKSELSLFLTFKLLF